MSDTSPVNIFWFRRDLRFHNNKGLYKALSDSSDVIPLFIFDTEIIDTLPGNDPRIEFIYLNVLQLHKTLRESSRHLWVYKGKPIDIIRKLTSESSVNAIYTNKDHEPYGINRDREIELYLQEKGIDFHTSLDHLLFEKDEILKKDNSPYNVFTPYSKKCKHLLNPTSHFKEYPSEALLHKITQSTPPPFPELEQLGFRKSGLEFPDKDINASVLEAYHKTRDYPAKEGTTRLGMHLRFGTISIRELAQKALNNNEVYFNELLWREFYAMVLWHYPYVVTKAFKPKYDKVEWINNPDHFELWKEGKTGYPMVDAGMRELRQTGYMHNRVRMITASFLTKHLLSDWRLGEAWFAEWLLDYELSSNNGGWQWSAGSGCDAAPYFRIFNPIEQQKKFDNQSSYIHKWIPEFNTSKYPQPVVEHKFARQRCLDAFKKALNS